MNEEKKRRKLEEKRIKAINNSLKYLSKSAQDELGVLSVQEQEHVFYCGGRVYKKIYTFKPAILKNKKNELIKALCELFDNRMRLTMCVKNKNKKLSAYMFLTVTFEADSYYEVQSVIHDFEEKLKSEIATILNISILECDLDSTLSYIYLNSTGEMKQMDIGQLFAKKGMHRIFEKCIDSADGKFVCGNRHGISLVGKNYPRKLSNMSQIFYDQEGSFQICVDFKKFSNEDKEIFQYDLNRKYSTEKIELVSDEIINMSFFITAMTDTKEELDVLEQQLTLFYDTKKVQIMPGSGRAKNIFYSSSSLGLHDFRSMQNVTYDKISELLL